MNQVNFNAQISELIDAFGEKAYPVARCKLIWQYCEDLEDFEFTRIVKSFLATARQAPMPVDFKQLAQAQLRSRDPAKFEIERDLLKDRVACDRCLGSGVVMIADFVQGEARKAHTIMICECDFGLQTEAGYKVTHIPTWSRECGQIWTQSPPPMSWFKPKSEVVAETIASNEECTKLIEQFRGRIQKANEYWQEKSKLRIVG